MKRPGLSRVAVELSIVAGVLSRIQPGVKPGVSVGAVVCRFILEYWRKMRRERFRGSGSTARDRHDTHIFNGRTRKVTQ